MEKLLHYVWKHKLFPPEPLYTTAGQPIEIIDTGLHNTNAGPDFFNAKVKIGGEIWVGNVEIHDHSSDWFVHNHHRDDHYNNVILHIAEAVDADVKTANGLIPPQLQLTVPPLIAQHYTELLQTDDYPPCYQIIPNLMPLTVHSWLNALETERLERKTDDILRRVSHANGSWEAGYFITLARSYGFGINSDAFEQWASSIPLNDVAHHRDDLFQVEAIFLGLAGLLETSAIPERHRAEALADDYYQHLQKEYVYLAHKFNFKPVSHSIWRFLRLRPANFPHIRINQLAHLYYMRKAELSQIIACTSLKEACEALTTSVTPYWENHYSFGAESPRKEKKTSTVSLNLLLINAVIPTLFAYGRHKQDERLCERAFSFLEQLKAENNHIVRTWQRVGLNVETAADSQALIQLKKEYCDRKDCLRCRFGYEYLKKK